MSRNAVVRDWLFWGLLVGLSLAGCARWRAASEKGMPEGVIRREAAPDQADLVKDLHQGVGGVRGGP